MTKNNVLISDYDNTLCDHFNKDKDNLILTNLSFINDFMKNNYFILATGRYYESIVSEIEKYNIKFDYLICNNGSDIYDNKFNLIKATSLTSDIELFFKKNNIKDYVKRYAYKKDQLVTIHIYFDDKIKYDNVKNILTCLDNLYEIEYKYPKIKILNKQVNKAKAINYILEHNLLDVNDIVSIGDDVNDLQMLRDYNGYTIRNSSLSKMSYDFEEITSFKEIFKKIKK